MKPRAILAALAFTLCVGALSWCWLAALYLHKALDGISVFLFVAAAGHGLGAAWLLGEARKCWRFNRASKAADAALARMRAAAAAGNDTAFFAALDQTDAAIADMRAAQK